MYRNIISLYIFCQFSEYFIINLYYMKKIFVPYYLTRLAAFYM